MNARFWKPVVGVCLSTLLVGHTVFAQPEVVNNPSGQSLAQAERIFASTVQTLFSRKCGGCHGDAAIEIKGGLDMRSRDGLILGGESGEPSVVPGKPEESPLLDAIRWIGLEMPPKENDRLTTKQIDAVRIWIAGGAPWPTAERRRELANSGSVESDSDAEVTVATSGGLSDDWTNRRYRREDLWAYQPVVRPPVPRSDESGNRVIGNPVDGFVHRKLTQAGIEPTGRTDKLSLIRRATYDLTGLPPTPSEIDDFIADDSPNAFQKVVDRLLGSPRYGEQWGKHWLDVVRYADTSGFSNDYIRPNAWRYRDYVIRSFNDDKPYDQFVREQIAGDELDASNVENLIAVGFLRMGPWEHTSMSVETVTRQQFLDDVTNSVGVTFLGQALQCAKCHDHKFDPIPTRDYYRMQAIFAPLQFAHREAAFLEVENTNGFNEGRKRIKALVKQGNIRSLRAIPKEEWPVAEFDADTETKGHVKVNKKRIELLNRELNRFEPLAYSVYNGPPRSYYSKMYVHRMPPPDHLEGSIPTLQILIGGALDSLGEAVGPGVLSVVFGASGARDVADISSVSDKKDQRRSALADWITSPTNPLTARVIVNRIWQYHFGKAIAGNPNNLGQTGKKPTHPELLDYLASYFIEQRWSIKSLHRLIMLSETYQRSAKHRQLKRVREIDPANDLYAYISPRRLTAEELRDTMLFISGELNLEMGGVPARPEINLEVAMQPRNIMGSVAPAYQPMRTPSERHRRTIYTERIRMLRDPMLEVFNQPSFDAACERRDSSATTPQVFALFNGQNSLDRGIAMALRLQRTQTTRKQQIESAFRMTLGRSPSEIESSHCLDHLAQLRRHHRVHRPDRTQLPTHVIRQMVEEMTGLTFFWVEDLDVFRNYVPDKTASDVDAATRALADLCFVLFNSNEFIYVY